MAIEVSLTVCGEKRGFLQTRKPIHPFSVERCLYFQETPFHGTGRGQRPVSKPGRETLQEKAPSWKLIELFRLFFTHEGVETCLPGGLPVRGLFIGPVLKDGYLVASHGASRSSPPGSIKGACSRSQDEKPSLLSLGKGSHGPFPPFDGPNSSQPFLP